MIDFGLVTLLVLQIAMVGACFYAFSRIQSERTAVNDKLDSMAKAVADSENRALVATQALAVSNELPKAFTKKQEIFEAELNALTRFTEKLEIKVTSALARMSANKRWNKNQDEEVEEVEEVNVLNNARKFGQRRLG